jgi:hypothetical protein
VAKVTPRKQIREGAKALEEIMLEFLDVIAQDLVEKVMGKARRLTPAERLKAISGLAPSGAREYQSAIEEAMAALANDALTSARREVPAAKKVQLSDFDDLPKDLQRKVKSRAQLLIGKQLGDLQKAIEFAYAQNEDTTDSDDVVEGDLKDAAAAWLDGPSVSAGSEITAATVVAQAREAFFFDPEVAEEIEAFEFVNGDPVSPVCQDLAGIVFAKDDPDLFRYTPPLHWNCKSYIRPILKGNLGNKEIQKLRPSSLKIEDSIQFSDAHHACPGCSQAEKI